LKIGPLIFSFNIPCVCVCARAFTLRGQIRARTWCCEVVAGCEVRFPTSSQLWSSQTNAETAKPMM